MLGFIRKIIDEFKHTNNKINELQQNITNKMNSIQLTVNNTDNIISRFDPINIKLDKLISFEKKIDDISKITDSIRDKINSTYNENMMQQLDLSHTNLCTVLGIFIILGIGMGFIITSVIGSNNDEINNSGFVMMLSVGISIVLPFLIISYLFIFNKTQTSPKCEKLFCCKRPRFEDEINSIKNCVEKIPTDFGNVVETHINDLLIAIQSEAKNKLGDELKIDNIKKEYNLKFKSIVSNLILGTVTSNLDKIKNYF